MKFTHAIIIVILSFIAITCNNLDNAELSTRNTFIKFYEGPYSMQATSVEILPDGFIIVGNMLVDDEVNDTSYVETVVIKTDRNGNRIGIINEFQGGTGKVIKPIFNGSTIEGYIVVGDSIYLDPLAEQAANFTVSSLRVLLLNENFGLVDKIYLTDTTAIAPNRVREDFTGESVTITDDGRVLILGTRKAGVVNQQTAPAEPFIAALTLDRDSVDWFKRYELNGRTSLNSKSVFHDNGSIIWASAIAEVTGEFTSSWVSIPIVEEESVFPNYSLIGQNSAQLFIPKDIHPSYHPSVGYGVVGTFSKETNGEKGNMFFLRVNPDGTIVEGSDRYFDAILTSTSLAHLPDSTESSIVDEGEAITSTNDGGFVLAGTLTTNPDKGNGGKDILLIKVNMLGDFVWMKTIGGIGDEVPSAIRETATGDLVICGTNTLGDYASVFLMRTDENGEVKN